jgi:hypothetical protein
MSQFVVGGNNTAHSVHFRSFVKLQCFKSRAEMRSTTSRMAGAKGTGSRHRTSPVAITALMLLTLYIRAIQARRLLEPAAGGLATVEAYTCIEAGVVQHPCVVNPAYTFTTGFKADDSNLADRSATDQRAVSPYWAMPAWQIDALLTLRNYCFAGHTKRSQPST